MSKHPAADISRNLTETQIPSNVDIQKGLSKTEEALQEEAKRQGYPQQKLAKDAAELLGTTKQFIAEKNEGELAQQLILDTSDAMTELTEQFKNQQFFIERNKLLAQNQDIKQLAQANTEALKNLALTLVNSQQFRGLLLDFIDIVKTIVNTEVSQQPIEFGIQETPTVPLTEEAKLKMQQVSQLSQKIASDIKEQRIQIPEDKRQQVYQRFNQLLNDMSRDPNFQSAINGIFQFFDQVQYWGLQMKEQAQVQVEQTRQRIDTSSVWKMWNDAKLLTLKFVPEQSLNATINDINNFYQLALNDPRLSNFLWEFRVFVTNALRDPALLQTEEYKQKWNDLYVWGYEWMNDVRYKDAMNIIWSDLMSLINCFKSDTLTQKLGQDIGRVARDVVLDESGKPNLLVMSQGVNNLTTLIGPILRKNLENVPIPPFTGSNETYDWQIEGMYVNASSFVPDNFEVKVWGDAIVSLTSEPSKAATYITMWIRDVGLEAKDLKFHFKRKTMPKLDESGVADVSISGKGTVIKIVWRIVGQQDQPWIINVYQVNCTLGSLDITVKESTHTWLMKLITTLFSGSIRRSIEDKIELSIAEGLGAINDQIRNALQNVPSVSLPGVNV